MTLTTVSVSAANWSVNQATRAPKPNRNLARLLAPPLEEVMLDVQHVEDLAHDEVDKVVD